MKIKKNDEVIVISGAHKTKTGRVLSVNTRKETITIDKINIVKKHIKPSQTNPDGGIKEFEAPIHVSNVAINVKVAKGQAYNSRIKYEIKDDKKIRIAVKTGKAI